MVCKEYLLLASPNAAVPQRPYSTEQETVLVKILRLLAHGGWRPRWGVLA